MKTYLFEYLKDFYPDLKNKLLQIYGNNLLAAIIFGSGARGDIKEGSDLDILIILKNSDKSFKQRIKDFEEKMGYYFSDVFNIAYSPIILVLDEIKKPHPFLLGVFSDYIVLYQKGKIVDKLKVKVKDLVYKELYLNGKKYWMLKNER